jgi:tripartite-type tricarboxylate transporter receptor subunit TctC
MRAAFSVPLLALLALGAVFLSRGVAPAAEYPDKPIRWIVPYAAGGTTDVIARNVAQAMSQMFGWTIVIDNRAGAGGRIAMGAVAKVDPDGYMLLVSDASLATAPSLYAQLPFDPVKDLAPIAMFATVPHIVVASPEVKARSLGELIALAKQDPGKFNFGSGGVGSPLHLAGEALRAETGIPWTHIPYRGAGPAILASITNEVQVATPSLPAALSQVQAGKLRALAVMSPKRLSALPGVPTVAELGFPKATVQGWVGLHAPAGTPPAVLSAIEAAIAKALQNPELRERLAAQGADISTEMGAAYGKLVANEAARWKQVVEAAGIPPQQ